MPSVATVERRRGWWGGGVKRCLGFDFGRRQHLDDVGLDHLVLAAHELADAFGDPGLECIAFDLFHVDFLAVDLGPGAGVLLFGGCRDDLPPGKRYTALQRHDVAPELQTRRVSESGRSRAATGHKKIPECC